MPAPSGCVDDNAVEYLLITDTAVWGQPLHCKTALAMLHMGAETAGVIKSIRKQNIGVKVP